MKKEFIPYEQALELKELGFNEECSAYYFVYQDKLRFSYAGIEFDFDSGNDYIDLVNYSDYTPKEYAIAPTYRQAFRWFREKYNITSEISISANHRNDAKKWMHSVTNLEVMLYTNSDTTFETYEEAELACLKKLIEIAKNK